MDESRYEGISDEEIVALAQGGDLEAMDYLLVSYKQLVTHKCRPYFLVGADRDDLIQEGMIGLYKAVREYDPTRSIPFRPYAELRIQNQVMTAVRATSRQKHIPLNSYVSLNLPVFEGDESRTLMDTLTENRSMDPMELLIDREDLDSIEKRLQPRLSALEKEVYGLYLEGKNYQEIARTLGRTAKSIDNTLWRLKFKMAEVLREEGIVLESAREDERRAQMREKRREAVRTNAREHARKKARAASYPQGRKGNGDAAVRKEPNPEEH